MIQYTAPMLILVAAAVAVHDTTVHGKVPGHDNVSSDNMLTIEDVARQYRIQTYDNFRTQRAEYNRRIAIGEEALRRHNVASDARQNEIFNWFTQSATAMTLPQLPGGEIQTPDQIAGNVADRVTNSVAFESPKENTAPSWEQTQHNESTESSISNETLSGEIDFDANEEWNDTEDTYETAVVRNEKFGVTSKSRTFSILGSVGRAVTFAVAKGTGGNGKSHVGNMQFEPVGAADTEGPEFLEVEDEIIEDEPTLAIRHEEEVTEEDLELEQLILESPAGESGDDLEPTPETFLRESSWSPKSSTRLARRIEKLEKSLHRITVKLDMPGMTVHQIEGAVELAEEMCWNYRTVATYLEATGGDASVVDPTMIRNQVDRLADRLGKGLSLYREAVKNNPSISHYIVTLEELQLRAEILKGEINA